MAILNEAQITRTYFDIIGGFPPENKTLRELKDYNGEDQLCVACTQLPCLASERVFGIKGYSEKDQRRILKEWISFLKTNPKALRALHFNSRVPQILFDAACHQSDLEELRFKWGAYSDLSTLENLHKLKFLYIGQGASVIDITTLGNLKNLVVLHVEAFKRIEDFSQLTTLDNLEQLVISGSAIGKTPVKDLEFLRDMPNLRSIAIGNVNIQKKYSCEELASLHLALPNLHAINNCLTTI
jgi:hypothetical protein